MSLVPYWLRHLRNLAYRDPVVRALEDPFVVFAKDPFFRDPLKYISQVTAPLERESGIDGVYSEAEVKVDGKKVEVHLDVRNFTPEQIQVKTVGNEITVEGQREVRRGTSSGGSCCPRASPRSAWSATERSVPIQDKSSAKWLVNTD